MTVSVETAAFAAILTFVCGFFVNLISMKKLFVSAKEFKNYKEASDEYRKMIKEQTSKYENTFQQLCDLNRARCQPIQAQVASDISEIKRHIEELFKLVRGNNV